LIFPLAYLALGSALTVLLIVAGLAGEATLAAEMAVVQGALLATFYAFSANARSLILQGHDALTAEGLLAKRVLALPLLAAAGYLLCVHAAGVPASLALALIARRCCEWLAEVRLCEIEVAGDRRAARRTFAVQAAITLATAALLLSPRTRLAALAVFAVSPLFTALPRWPRDAFRPAALLATLRGATPHLGSTAIDGISTYVQRLVVFLVAGREMAGLLFTAFVLGSFVASLFANIVGPSLALQRARDAQPRRRRAVWLAALALAAIGAALLAAGQPDWGGKPGWFWLALGFSFIGAALMIVAQTIRLRLFDERRAEVLFGPDVLRNLTAIVAAPALYFLVSPPALGALYLVTALLTLVFYWSARQGELLGAGRAGAALQVALAAALLFPLFFLLSGRVYHVRTPLLDSAGTLLTVPLPLSLAACFAGIMLLARYRQAALTLGAIFFLFIGMVFTSAAISQGDVASESRKLVLLFQFLLPAFALVLGQMFGALRPAATAFAIVLAVLVPAQLLRSLGHPGEELRHDLWLFSVYQHLQYVPPVVVCAWLVAVFALWEERRARWLLVALAPLVALYASRSYATLAIALAVGSGLLVFLARPRERAAQLCVLLVFAAVAGFLYANRDAYPLRAKFDTSGEDTAHRLKQAPSVEVSRAAIEAVPGPMQARLAYWTLYARGIGESAKAALLGHPRAIERSVAPSAHNYYLDFVYNFGVLAFAPLAWLIGFTALLLWRQRHRLRTSPLLGLAAAVAFALCIDSMFKVPLRQPYTGVFFFFLWGLLLAQLQPRR
jgi:O-antigen ligase